MRDKGFAYLSWCIGDVQAYFDVTDEEAERFLFKCEDAIRDRLCEVGNEVIETLGLAEGLKVKE